VKEVASANGGIAMKVPDLFKGVRYVGKAEGDRKTYYVFESDSGYLVVAPNSTGGFNVNIVDGEVPDVVTSLFKSKKLTSGRLKQSNRRPDLFGPPFASLNALYVMVALGRARKLKRREGKAMVFKILK
jgi:hypothetical protein